MSSGCEEENRFTSSACLVSFPPLMLVNPPHVDVDHTSSSRPCLVFLRPDRTTRRESRSERRERWKIFTLEFSGWTLRVLISGSDLTTRLHHSILFTFSMTMWMNFPSSNVHIESSFLISAKVSPSMMAGWPRRPTNKCFRERNEEDFREHSKRLNILFVRIWRSHLWIWCGHWDWWGHVTRRVERVIRFEMREWTNIDFFQSLCPGVIGSGPSVAWVGLFFSFVFFVFIGIFYLFLDTQRNSSSLDIQWTTMFTFSSGLVSSSFFVGDSVGFTSGISSLVVNFWA